MDIITIKNLTLTIKDTQILKDISVSFETGKIHGLIGRNRLFIVLMLADLSGIPEFQEPASE